MFARAILAAVAACGGLIDVSPWAIGAGALAITGERIEACLAFADKYGATLGWSEAASLFIAANAAKHGLACAIAFTAGRLLGVLLT